MESGHGKSKGDGAGSNLKEQLDQSVYIENKFHHNTNEFLIILQRKIYIRDSGRTRSWVFHFLIANQVIKKEDEKDFERIPGTLKIR